MFSKKHIINLVSVFLILFIDSTYMLIYSPRSVFNPPFISFSYFVLFLFIIRSVVVSDFFHFKIFNKNSLTIFLLLFSLTLTLAVFNITDILHIEKYMSAKLKLMNMHYYMNNLQMFDHKYYGVKLLDIFRRLLGVAGLMLICFYFIKNSTGIKLTVLKVVVLLFTPMIYTTIIIQGELLFFTGFLILIITNMEKGVIQDRASALILLYSCLAGIVLFLNLTSIIFIIIYILYYFRNNAARAIGVLLLTLLIFILLNIFTGSPFLYIIELSGLKWILIVFFILACYIGWSVSNLKEVLFSSGILTFLLLTGIVIADIAGVGVDKVHIRIYSLNLLQYCIPVLFLLTSVHEYKIESHMGKILPVS